MGMKVGDMAELTKTVQAGDIDRFADLTSDYNPIHFDIECPERDMFPRRIAHGTLTAGMISAVLGTKLPGPGTIYLEQGFKFLGPVYVEDTITARVAIIDIQEKRNGHIVRCSTDCYNQTGECILTGEAVVMRLK
jgi:3-hydroxybutyryl-CoA dehydratase